ncbi:MAG: SPOR domain-containing protein [Bacillota bacterium]
MRRSRGRKSSPTSSVVIVLLLITTLAIGTGYFLSRFLISSFADRDRSSDKPGTVAVQPSSGSGTNPTPSTPAKTTPDPNPTVPATTVKVTPTLPSVLYGQVQMGAFAQEANATTLAATLKGQGFPASVVKRDNLYRVVVGVFAERSIADEYKKALEAKGNKDILLSSNEIHLTAAKTYQGSEADLVKALGTLVTDAADITGKLLQVSDQLYNKSVDQTTWQKAVAALNERVVKLEQVQLPSAQSSLSGEWTKLVADLKTHLASQGSRKVGDLAAWGSSQAELTRILGDLQAIYAAVSM